MNKKIDYLGINSEIIFDNMNEAVVLIDGNDEVIYSNNAANNLYNKGEEISIEDNFVNQLEDNRDNKQLIKFFKNLNKNKEDLEDVSLVYNNGEKKKHLVIKTDKIIVKGKKEGYIIMTEDVTATQKLQKFQKDSAVTFTGLITFICLYLFTWSLFEFTLKIHLKTSVYTSMIEIIAFILFLQILFFTGFSLKDIGCFVMPKTLLKTIKEVVPFALIICALMFGLNAILWATGHPLKSYFMGGSVNGAVTYISVAVLQEFLSRGVIQKSIAYLVRSRFQSVSNVFLSSILFTLMHLPFGFPFMMGAFALSILLGSVFEIQKNIWGCVILHWTIGYLAMALFF
jgi:membrane protease YdiL (CAAX protease family)